jgi:aerobic-type carbon monoxide dehydrogenase small subunit (CoxS/CutS family)
MSELKRKTIHFKLNGQSVSASVATHETAIEILQRDFNLYGARESCGQGLCGCCTLGSPTTANFTQSKSVSSPKTGSSVVSVRPVSSS